MFVTLTIIGENQSKCENNLTYYIKLDRNTELARAVDVIIARAKRIYILMTKVRPNILYVLFVLFNKQRSL